MSRSRRAPTHVEACIFAQTTGLYYINP